jgi:hypothetical protein
MNMQEKKREGFTPGRVKMEQSDIGAIATTVF